jgi:hypothetical protein
VVHIRVKYQVGSPQPYSLASTGEHSNESYASLEELIIRNRNFMRDPCKVCLLASWGCSLSRVL